MVDETINEVSASKNFIKSIIESELAESKCEKQFVFRFPPEPNGYLHIGHAKSICLNFGLADQMKSGICRLRFDDTNPVKEEQEYMDAIKSDIKWLGFQWHGEVRHASDYFARLYEYACDLIRAGKAYVCDLNPEQTREFRGTLTKPGRNSPFRERSVEENFELFERMKNGEFSEGACVLRAKIDMNSGNINMRDPAIYRILHASHYRSGSRWCIYPMYDFAHCLSDYIENVTHSLCTLEFQDHRPLYNWFLENLVKGEKPRQYEFARLNLSHTITSKRRLKDLIDEGIVQGWDDPRMPTLAGLKRRGYTPQAIRRFCERIGVSKKEGVIDISILEEELRNHLNETAKRAMCVLQPLKVVIDNLPEDYRELLVAPNNPLDPSAGTRELSFSNQIYIERDDFSEAPPPKYRRLSPGKEVRLRYSYVMKCTSVEHCPATGVPILLRCTIDHQTLGKNPEGRKVRGAIHWVCGKNHVKGKVNIYDRLFADSTPGVQEKNLINPNSLKTLSSCVFEKSLAGVKPLTSYQFERQGYFVADSLQSTSLLIFNRSVTLKDSWSKSHPSKFPGKST